MSIAAAQISAEALHDMIHLFQSQPWTRHLHEELAELWNICTSREQQILVRDLITDFCMFDAEREANACKQFNEQIQSWGLKPSDTWIIAVANANEVDGSSAGLQKLKNKVLPYEVWHSRFVSNIPTAAKNLKNGDNVILFDDFVGTGKKMVRKVAWFKSILEQNGIKNVNLFCACFSGMQFGIQHAKDELKVPVFTSIALKRGISERYTDDKLTTAIRLMKEIEAQLAPTYRNKKLTEYTFGYEQSEALYCAANDNCPNNVFPVLWWAIKKDNTPFKTLLRRAG